MLWQVQEKILVENSILAKHTLCLATETAALVFRTGQVLQVKDRGDTVSDLKIVDSRTD
jgi:hypothetical protein